MSSRELAATLLTVAAVVFGMGVAGARAQATPVIETEAEHSESAAESVMRTIMIVLVPEVDINACR